MDWADQHKGQTGGLLIDRLTDAIHTNTPHLSYQSMARKLGELLCFPYFSFAGLDYRSYLSKARKHAVH